jgi:hypothetical protein
MGNNGHLFPPRKGGSKGIHDERKLYPYASAPAKPWTALAQAEVAAKAC